MSSQICAVGSTPPSLEDSQDNMDRNRHFQNYISIALQVFSHTLVKRAALLDHFGAHELAVAFAIEPNGDILAYHWFDEGSFWVEFGAYIRSTNSLIGERDFLLLYNMMQYASDNLLVLFKYMAYTYKPTTKTLYERTRSAPYITGRDASYQQLRSIIRPTNKDLRTFPTVAPDFTQVPPVGLATGYGFPQPQYGSGSIPGYGQTQTHYGTGSTSGHGLPQSQSGTASAAVYGLTQPHYGAVNQAYSNAPYKHQVQQQQALEDPFTSRQTHTTTNSMSGYPSTQLNPGQRPTSIDPDYRFPPPAGILQQQVSNPSYSVMVESPGTKNRRLLKEEFQQRHQLVDMEFLDRSYDMEADRQYALHGNIQDVASPYAPTPASTTATNPFKPFFLDQDTAEFEKDISARATPVRSDATRAPLSRGRPRPSIPIGPGVQPFAHQLSAEPQNERQRLLMRKYLERLDEGENKDSGVEKSSKRTVLNDPLQSGRVNVSGQEKAVCFPGDRHEPAVPLTGLGHKSPDLLTSDTDLLENVVIPDLDSKGKSTSKTGPIFNAKPSINEPRIASQSELQQVSRTTGYNAAMSTNQGRVYGAANSSLQDSAQAKPRGPNDGHYMGGFQPRPDNRSKEQKLNDWFYSGTELTRQREHELSNLFASSKSPTASKYLPFSITPSLTRSPDPDPGPIARPSPMARSKPSTNEDTSTPNAAPSAMSLLLYSVGQNLQQYRTEKDELERQAQCLPPELREEFFSTKRPYFNPFGAIQKPSGKSSSSEEKKGDDDAKVQGGLTRKDSKDF